MLLVIDVGNTNIVLGVFCGQELQHSWRIATLRERTADEYAVLCHDLFELSQLSPGEIDAVSVCSVVPPLNECFQLMSRRYFQQEPFFVDPADQDLMPILYEPVSDVGADRIVNAVAAYRLFGGPAIVVDFGTATTFDAVSQAGEYLGGIIAPGVGISAEALFTRTAKLPRVEIRKPPRIIGNSTVTSMQAGIYFGYVGLVEEILRRMKQELGEPHVIATGGLAQLICGESKYIERVEENLTLYGLRMFHQWRSRKT